MHILTYDYLSPNFKTLNMATTTGEQSFLSLMDELIQGTIRIPEFQRAFVWTAEDVELLLDSVMHEYPIGLFLIWKSKDSLKEKDPLGLKLKPRTDSEIKHWLLDGQQRLISLVGAFNNNLRLGRNGTTEYNAYYDLKNRKFKVIKRANIIGKKPKIRIEDYYLQLDKLFKKNASAEYELNSELVSQFNNLYLNDVNFIFLKFSSLKIPVVIESKSLAVACKIFERLNNTGMQLSVVDLMVAKTFTANFNLRDKLQAVNETFITKDFDLSDISILQAMSSCIKQGISRDDILDSAENQEIEKKWDMTVKALEKAIDFVRTNRILLTSRFMPNDVLLSPITYFFYTNNGTLTENRSKSLKRYFWRSCLSNRYGDSQISKIHDDLKEIDKLVASDTTSLFNYPVNISAEQIKSEELSFNSIFAKTLLCVLAQKQPKDFKSGNNVSIEKTFSEANSNSMHHIFPRKVLEVLYKNKNNYEKEIKPFINSIANISMLSLADNKEIWYDRPSVYFKKFNKENRNLKVALDSQFIGDLKEFGIENDNFPTFINKRSKLIENEIKKLIAELD